MKLLNCELVPIYTGIDDLWVVKCAIHGNRIGVFVQTELEHVEEMNDYVFKHKKYAGVVISGSIFIRVMSCEEFYQRVN